MISMFNRLRDREDGVPGMGLIYGEPGLGKTYAITWWAAQNDAILIRSANLMSARWLLEEIIEELGEIPYNKFSDIFNQVIAQLIKTPRLIIVDETDYLTIDSRAVETLRDIHDKTNVPTKYPAIKHPASRYFAVTHILQCLHLFGSILYVF